MTQRYAHLLSETTPAGVRTLTDALRTMPADPLPPAVRVTLPARACRARRLADLLAAITAPSGRDTATGHRPRRGSGLARPNSSRRGR